jgi:hypothetical protein
MNEPEKPKTTVSPNLPKAKAEIKPIDWSEKKTQVSWDDEHFSDLFYVNQLDNDELTWRLYIGVIENNEMKGILVDKGILQDYELGINVNHEYNGNAMRDPIGDVIKGLHSQAKGALPFLNSAGNLIDSFTNFADGGSGAISSAGNTVKKMMETGKTFIDKGAKALTGDPEMNGSRLVNSEFLSAFDLIQRWTGTKTSFQIPVLETTWISGLKIKDISQPSIKKRFNEIIERILGETKEAAGMWGLQEAPNDYSPTFTGLKEEHPPYEGTFTLVLGRQYVFQNLILRNFDFRPSVIKAKGNKEPLYATVRYELDHASFVTKKKLENILDYGKDPKITTLIGPTNVGGQALDAAKEGAEAASDFIGPILSTASNTITSTASKASETIKTVANQATQSNSRISQLTTTFPKFTGF